MPEHLQQQSIAAPSEPNSMAPQTRLGQEPVSAGAARSGIVEEQTLQPLDSAAAAPQQQQHHAPEPTFATPQGEDRDSVLPALQMPPPALRRIETEAIGAPTDLPTPMLGATPSALALGPVVQFTLLLASTGTRHPYQLNERYLAKRNIKAETDDGRFDPTVISVYTLKELILKDWRDDWDEKPSSPSAIRLIYLGRLLDDKLRLNECKFNIEHGANVLHVAIKPQDIVEDEEAAKGGKPSMSRDRDGAERTSGCHCVIL